MDAIFIISAIFFAWWLVSIFYLPKVFRRHSDWRRKAQKKSGKFIVKIAFVIYALGGICNHVVKAENGDKMPVMEYGIYTGPYLPDDATKCREAHDPSHTCIHKKTRFAFLGDIFTFRSIGYILSIGDLLGCAGTGLMTLQRIWIFLPSRRKRIH